MVAKKKKTVLLLLLIILGGLLLTVLSLFWPKWVTSAREMPDLTYGLPFGYMRQTTTLVFDTNAFPRYMILQPFSGLFSYSVNIIPAFGSWFANSLIIGIIVFVNRQIVFMHRAKHPGKTKKHKDDDNYIPMYE